MANNTQEVAQVYLTANANLQCFNGPGVCYGIFVASASNTPLLTVTDSNSNIAGNVSRDPDGTGNQTIAAQFVPAAATFYRLPAKVLNGLNVTISGNVVCTVFGNKG